MKKVLAISILAALILGVLAIGAMADATNWQLIVKATDSAGMSSSGSVMIGCVTGFTDGVDSGKGEPTAPMAPGPDSTIATAAAVLDGGALSVRDFKAPIVGDATKNWTLLIYQQTTGAGPNLGTITVNISLASSAYLPAYNIGGTDYEYVFSGAYDKTFDAATPISNFSFEVPAAGQPDAATLNLVVRPVVPEPSSLVALASGLIGLVGFGIRRRR